jgi:hypothetical protein
MDSQIAIIEAELAVLRIGATRKQIECLDEVQDRLNLIRELMQE